MNIIVNSNNKFNPLNIMVFLVTSLSLLLVVCTLGWLLIQSHYGLDLTDESFYLIWMTNPWIYNASMSQFGFIYHPLSLLLHGDITLLRQINILIIFGLTGMLFYMFCRMRALSAIFASCSFIYLCPFGWLATPSYNSLTFQALLLAGIGVLCAKKEASRSSIAGWVLLGIAGWLVFMAKPSSAGALTVAVGVYILLAGKFNYRLLFLALLTSTILLAISAWWIDGSLTDFIVRYKLGMANMELLQLKTQLFRLDQLDMSRNETGLLALTSLLLGVITYLSALNKKIMSMLTLVLPLALTVLGFVIIFWRMPVQITPHTFSTLQIVAIPLGALFAALLLMKMNVLTKRSREPFALALFFVSLPYVFALGSSNNYWFQSQLAGIFWVLAGLVILAPAISMKTHWRVLLPIAVTGQWITLVLLQLAMDHPYRQLHPLHEDHQPVSIGANHTTITLSEADATYFHTIQTAANHAGFKTHTPVIDLSGQSPGTLYALGGKSIGQPWMIGGYPGSDQFVIASLDSVDCRDIAAAWILFEPQSTPQISPTILQHVGINVKKDYIIAGEFTTPLGAGGWDSTIHRKQQLLKPTRSLQEAIDSCTTSRKNRAAS